tara:strand:- start:3246 stop:3677 length:432 start_codon:yes stop_codon:yes gene_type:complete
MRKLIYLFPLFLIGCGDNCEFKTTFFKTGEVQTIQKNIDCDASKGIENISYNKIGTIIKLEHKLTENDSISRKLFFDEGNLKSIYFEVNHNKTGVHKKFFKNGKIRSLTSYLNGEKHGDAFEWYEDGKVRKQVTYNNDSLIQQ